MSMSKRSLAIVAGLAAVLLASPALASPVYFENPEGPNHFLWYGDHSLIGLDLTVDAASQTGAYGDVGQFRQDNIEQARQVVRAPAAWTGYPGRLQVDDVTSLLFGVDEGTSIPVSGNWIDWKNDGSIYSDYHGTLLPAGLPTYLSLNFTSSDGLHYGWIGVEMFVDPADEMRKLDAFAWGYETEVETPILAGVPEPGSLALLTLGAAAALRRRA
ncbi:MAG: PEP-CTERM sorting domain-containing protein [Phycisphaerae bacterium]|jgi:hypothetical protein